MKYFNIFVIYVYLFVLNLRILPVMSQPPKTNNPTEEGTEKASVPSDPVLSGGLAINAKCMPMVIYYVNK